MCTKKLVFVAFIVPLTAILSGNVFDFSTLGHLLGYIPSDWITRIAAFSLWLSTVKVVPVMKRFGLVEFEDCFEQNVSETLKSIVAAPKGGAFFSGMLVHAISVHCGISLGMVAAVEDNWKDAPPDILPDHEVDLLMVIGVNSIHWGEYRNEPFSVHKKLQCIVVTRNPFERFLSLYKYTRDAGESGLKVYSREMSKIDDFEDRVNYIWSTFGEMMMTRTHSLLTTSIKMNCTQIKADELFFVSSEKHDELVEIILKTYGVKDEVVPVLLKKLQKNDMNRKTEEEKAANRHISGRNLQDGEKEFVKRFIRSDPEISKVLSKQCSELNFAC